MGNERKLRLIQVAKEFKVGLNTITDFLQKKGIKSDGSPNTLVDSFWRRSSGRTAPQATHAIRSVSASP